MNGHPQDLTLRDQALAIESGELDAGEVLSATLERIEERNEGLTAIVATFPEESAKMLDDAPPGPLHGVPIGIKDMYTLPWRAPQDGSSKPNPRFPAGESAVYKLLRDAGAVIAGVTQCHLYGASTTGSVSAYGPVGNPWNREHVGGGSSGGSASAVGARLVAGAVGSDGGGSIRLPAAYCGVTGLKVTFGAIPQEGFIHAFESLCSTGPICRDAGDTRLLSRVLMGSDLPSGDGAGLRVGVCREPYWEDLDPEVLQACDRALDALAEAGAQIVDVSIEGAELTRIALGMRLLMEQVGQHSVEDVALLEGDIVGSALMKYVVLRPAGILLRADRVRAMVRRSIRDLFDGGVDVLAWPSIPAPAPRIDDPTVTLPSGPTPADRANVRQSGVGNLTGCPAMSVPVGLSSTGLPLGLELSAAWDNEAVLLDAAELLERATDREWVDAEPAAAVA